SWDIVVCDPPAFAKKRGDLRAAARGYQDVNRLAMSLVAPGGWLLTCSCSHHIDESLFRTIMFHASRQARRSARILGRHIQAADHPVHICHPETEYLKSFLLWVE
ncbi:MAG: class I SAM-dependent rRNA methyltransferase, partial [Patescibacteria group bacterium]